MKCSDKRPKEHTWYIQHPTNIIIDIIFHLARDIICGCCLLSDAVVVFFFLFFRPYSLGHFNHAVVVVPVSHSLSHSLYSALSLK